MCVHVYVKKNENDGDVDGPLSTANAIVSFYLLGYVVVHLFLTWFLSLYYEYKTIFYSFQYFFYFFCPGLSCRGFLCLGSWCYTIVPLCSSCCCMWKFVPRFIALWVVHTVDGSQCHARHFNQKLCSKYICTHFFFSLMVCMLRRKDI